MTLLKSFLIELWYPKGRTDSDLSRALEVDQSLVSMWVTGARRPPLERQIQIAKTIGCDSRQIFPDSKMEGA